MGAAKTKRGTISALVVSYYKSPEFISLKSTTKNTYRREIERLRDEHGHRIVAQMKRHHVVKLLEPLTDRPSARNNRLRTLRMFLSHGVEIGMLNTNVTTTIKKMKTNLDGFHTWADVEVERFFQFHLIDSVAHTAVTLMLYTACARSDVVSLGWQNIKAGSLQYKRKKMEGHSPVAIDIPIHRNLQDVLNILPKNRMTFLETHNGKSRSSNGLGNLMRKWCDEAGLPNCTSHGLRKACATRLAEAGFLSVRLWHGQDIRPLRWFRFIQARHVEI